ncbi:MAG: TPM domain-containing protein [Proteobacteria bacterium]|nr:TPM domain-containing protein [Pseudomonadota bacterium]
MSLVSETDQKRISDAITSAETRTSGEIVAVIAPESASYLSVPVLVAALVALIVPWPFIFFTWMNVEWIYLIQLLVFIGLLLALLPRAMRFLLVPKSIQHQRAHSRAVEQFLVQNMDSTLGRTGVLIYVSVAERYAEILADQGLHPKVAQSEWQAIVDEMTATIGDGRPGDALVGAIGRVGAILAKHFPPTALDERRLPDHLIVLD